jgi:hypothetical protein
MPAGVGILGSSTPSGRGISESRRTIAEVSAHRLDLVGAADQRALFIGFRRERGQGAGCDSLIEQPFGGADRIRAAPGDVAGRGQGLAEGIGGQSRGEPERIRPV